MSGRWIFGARELGYVNPWNEAIAEQHASATERMLLGAAGRTRVVGNRRDEAILADRERRVAQMAMGALA